MGDDFLSRWSRLKRRGAAAEHEPAQEPRDASAPSVDPPPEAIARRGSQTEAAETEASVAPTEEEIAALPSLDSLSEGSDLGPFLRAGVPSALRNAALRRMWSLDPSIRDFVSEAREYAYDWNSPGGVPGLGPLLPSDDVKAMVRRIFEGPDRTPDSDAEAAREVAEADRQASDPDRPEAALRPALAEASPPEGLPDALPAAMRAPGEECVLASGSTASEAIARPRMRRHGGALPG